MSVELFCALRRPKTEKLRDESPVWIDEMDELDGVFVTLVLPDVGGRPFVKSLSKSGEYCVGSDCFKEKVTRLRVSINTKWIEVLSHECDPEVLKSLGFIVWAGHGVITLSKLALLR